MDDESFERDRESWLQERVEAGEIVRCVSCGVYADVESTAAAAFVDERCRRCQLRRLALDIVEGRVFGTWCLTEEQLNAAAAVVFMTIALGAKVDTSKVRHLYEYLDKAGPRSINGRPCFFSHRELTHEDADILEPMLKALQEQRESFLKKG